VNVTVPPTVIVVPTMKHAAGCPADIHSAGWAVAQSVLVPVLIDPVSVTAAEGGGTQTMYGATPTHSEPGGESIEAASTTVPSTHWFE